MNRMVCWTLCAALVCLGVLLFGGCSKSFTARQYPTFYDPNIRTVAVVPFRNDTRGHNGGFLMAEDLASALRINGTYSVIPPRKLRSLLREKKLPELSRTDYAQDAEQLRKLGGIQAFIVGRVLRGSRVAETYPAAYVYPPAYVSDDTLAQPARYRLVDEDEEEGEEGEGEDFGDGFDEGFDYDFGPPYPYWYWNYPYYYPEYAAQAHIAVEASMVRVSDGEILRATPSPVEGRADLSSSHRIAAGSVVWDAMHQAVAKLVKDFAAVPIRIKAYPHTDIRTASKGPAGQWQFQDTFSPTDEQMFVVLRLPFTVAHDSFRVTITPKGERDQVLASRDFVWPVGADTDAVEFSPAAMAPRMGAGQYTANLYSQRQLAMEHSFTMQ
jgi:hypothetical protein